MLGDGAGVLTCTSSTRFGCRSCHGPNVQRGRRQNQGHIPLALQQTTCTKRILRARHEPEHVSNGTFRDAILGYLRLS